VRLIPDHIIGIVCVFQEAEGESYEGKVAVAEVILRRTRQKYQSDGTVAGTVLKRLQFSGMNSDAANRIRSFKADSNDSAVADCIKAWAEAEAGSNTTNGAVCYYNPSLCFPKWAEGSKVLARIGNHVFVDAR